MSWELRVGAVQLCSTHDLTANLAKCAELAGQAVGDGAQLVVLPECFSFLGRTERDKLEIAEALDGDGPVMSALREMAVKHAVWIVGGGTPERVRGEPKRT